MPETSLPDKKAHIIVFGNQSEGCGKSTVAMHAAVALMRLGHDVATIDLDTHGGGLTAYIRNRWQRVEEKALDLPIPIHVHIKANDAADDQKREELETRFLHDASADLHAKCAFVIIDTPGENNHLNRLAHSYADTLVTVIGNGEDDPGLLADIDAKSMKILAPTPYAQMIEDQNVAKIERGERPVHWIVMRNRLEDRGQTVAAMLEIMADQFGFQPLGGFTERALFPDLFAQGLTLLDLKEDGHALSLAEVRARQEVRNLIKAIAPEKIKGYAL